MTQRLLIIIGLLCLFSFAQAQDNDIPSANDIFVDSVTVLEVLEPDNEPYMFIEQSGNWRISEDIRGHRLCNIITSECSEYLPILELYTGTFPSNSICESTWDEDGFIAESPDGQWVIFTDCGAATAPPLYQLFSYNLTTNEIYDLGRIGITEAIQMQGWYQDTTLIITTRLLRTSSTVETMIADVRSKNSLESIATQLAYAPRYFSESERIYWSEGLQNVDGVGILGWQFMAYDLASESVVELPYQINYSAPAPSDGAVGFVMSSTDTWFVAGLTYPLSPERQIIFYDKETGEIIHRAVVNNRGEGWTIGETTNTFWDWQYTYDGQNRSTIYSLTRFHISPSNITEMFIRMGEYKAQIYLSDNEDFLVLAYTDKIELYDINENEFILLTQENVNLCRDCSFEIEWQADNTLTVDIGTYYETFARWHISIDAISEANS